jgi:Ca2+-binding EF-hand superfamily protein
MITRATGIALALACVIVITPAMSPAQDSPRPNRPDRLRGLDTDGDGKVSFAEAKAGFPNLTQEAFDERDKNGDGFWTPEDRGERPGPSAPGMGPGGGSLGMMSRMDTNDDGKISFEEVKAMRPELTEEMFKQRDRNGDGYLSREDWTGMRPGQMPIPISPHAPGAMMNHMDKDGDAKISFEEAKAARPDLTEETFKQRDRNGDGFWSREDWPGILPPPSAITTPAPVSPGEAPSVDTPGRKSRMSRMDTDGDGKISFEEAQAARPGITEEMFKQRDRNGDGFWSAEDMPRRRVNPAPPTAPAPPVTAESEI